MSSSHITLRADFLLLKGGTVQVDHGRNQGHQLNSGLLRVRKDVRFERSLTFVKVLCRILHHCHEGNSFLPHPVSHLRGPQEEMAIQQNSVAVLAADFAAKVQLARTPGLSTP
eukprot:734160-Hanusia_phi.AAC.2